MQNGKIYIQADIIALRWLNGKQNEGVEVFFDKKEIEMFDKNIGQSTSNFHVAVIGS